MGRTHFKSWANLRYTLSMPRLAPIILLLAVLVVPPIVSAQMFPPLTELMQSNNPMPTPTGEVDIVVEGLTYKPSFYRGRAEPTVGNTVRLVAVPRGQAPDTLSYSWRAGGQVLPSSGPVATFSSQFSNSVTVSVSVTDTSGRLVARAEEVIRLSNPSVVFYEENLLRGHGSRAIINNHTLIGDSGVIRAEPYFVGLGISPTSYQVSWKVNNREVAYGNDWRELILERPEEPLNNYRINFSTVNRNNPAERAEGSFNLNFGL